MATTTPAPADGADRRAASGPDPGLGVSRGLVTITAATLALFVASALIASTSVSRGALQGHAARSPRSSPSRRWARRS